MGLLEKRRFRNFLIYTSDYDENDPKTFKGMNNQGTTSPSKMGLDACTWEKRVYATDIGWKHILHSGVTLYST